MPLKPEHFPDGLYFGNTPFQLDYVFDPGADNDGITMYVPEDQVNMLPDWALDYLVPGYLPDLVEILLKGLPREERRKISVQECTAEFIRSRESGGILNGGHIRVMEGVVSHNMSFVYHAADDVRCGFNHIAYNKEGCRCVMFFQRIQNRLGVAIFIPAVKGKVNHFLRGVA